MNTIIDQLLENYVPSTHLMTLAYHIRSAGIKCSDEEAETLRNATESAQTSIIEKKLVAATKGNGNKMQHASIVAFILKNKKGDYERIEDIRHTEKSIQDDDKAF